MTAPDEPPPCCLDQGTQTYLHEQAQHPGILALLVHNVQCSTAFEDGYARYWADTKARAPGMKGCTLLQALHCNTQMAVMYHMEDTPQQLASYHAHLKRPGRVGNLLGMGVKLEGARVHVLRRMGHAVEVANASSSCDGDEEAVVAIVCRVGNFNLWRAWWDGVCACASVCLPVTRLAAYQAASGSREQIAMLFTTSNSQVAGVFEWMRSRKHEMLASSVQVATARVYALSVAARYDCSDSSYA